MEKLQHAATAVVLMIFILEVPAMYMKDAPHHRREPSQHGVQQMQGKCGAELMAAIMMLCDGNTKHKKNIPDTRYEDEWGETSTFPFRSRRLSRTLIPMRMRRDIEGGIVEECCIKPCSQDEMRGYCLTPNERDD